MKRIFLLIIWFMSMNLHAANVLVLVSFSMPANLLQETLNEAASLKIPVVLNGLYKNSMRATALKVMELTQKAPNLNLQIDPTLFERFHIEQVPAVVAFNAQAFDVMYGHLSIRQALMRMAGHGDSGLNSSDVERLTGG